MRISIRFLPLTILFALILIGGACQSMNQNGNTTATASATPPAEQKLTQTPRPQTIEQMMKDRGEQDQAKPVLAIVSPAKNATINGSTVEVKLTLSGDLKGYMPHKDPATGKGNHIHVILDNQPYEAYYELDQPFELRNVMEGMVTLATGEAVTLADLPPEIASSTTQANPQLSVPTHSAAVVNLEAVERDAISTAITSCHGNLTLVAKELSISKSTLYVKVRKHGLDKTLLEARLHGR